MGFGDSVVKRQTDFAVLKPQGDVGNCHWQQKQQQEIQNKQKSNKCKITYCKKYVKRSVFGRKTAGSNLNCLEASQRERCLSWASRKAFVHGRSRQRWEHGIPAGRNGLPVNIYGVYQTPSMWLAMGKSCGAVRHREALWLLWACGLERRQKRQGPQGQGWDSYWLRQCLSSYVSLSLRPSLTPSCSFAGPQSLPVLLLAGNTHFCSCTPVPLPCSESDSSWKWASAIAS